jgi:hypothetical protein
LYFKTYHIVGTVPKYTRKTKTYQIVGRVLKYNRKRKTYHIVGTVPKYTRKTKTYQFRQCGMFLFFYCILELFRQCGLFLFNNNKKNKLKEEVRKVNSIFGALKPLSGIFQLYHGDQF